MHKGRSLPLLLLALCACPGPTYEWQLPPLFPEPFVPPDNPMSEAKVALGRHLFYDERLSGNGTMSCASCHEQARAFTDGKATPVGSTGDHVPRNSLSLTNVAYFSLYTWSNPVLETLEAQALVPMFGEAPVELGMSSKLEEILERLEGDERYPPLFERAFPDEAQPFTSQSLVKALASFQRTLISGSSAYDRYNAGDSEALSTSAKRGLELFFSEKAECYHCHGGFNFTTAVRTASTALPERDFQNTGLYNVDGQGAYPEPNTGLYEFTGQLRDMGAFRPPSLRNVAVTAPYMHDGSVATLEEVLDLYAAGGRLIQEGPNAGDGRENPHKNPLVRAFPLSVEEKQQLLDFLNSLTDEAFLKDSRFSSPF